MEFEKFEIKSKPYIGLADLSTAIGSYPSKVNQFIKVKEPKLEKYIKRKYTAPGHKFPFTIISVEGVKKLLPKLPENYYEDNPSLYYEVSEWVNGYDNNDYNETPTTAIATAPAPVKIGSDINQWELPNNQGTFVEKPHFTTPHDHGDEGRKIFYKMFHDKMVEFREINGETWLVARDIYKSFGIDKTTFYGAINRIRKINNGFVTSDSTCDKERATHDLENIDRNRNPKRILLNKNGISLLLNEINISRLKNEDTRKQLIEFKSWVATIVGDTLSGDLKITDAKEPTVTPVVKPRTPRMISDKRYASFIRQEFSMAHWLVVSGQISPFDCYMTAVKAIQNRSGIDTTVWQNLIDKHHEKMSVCLPPPMYTINIDTPTTKNDGNNGGNQPSNNFAGIKLPSVFNDINLGKQEKETVLTAKAIVAAMEQNGVNPHDVFKDAENILANYN